MESLIDFNKFRSSLTPLNESLQDDFISKENFDYCISLISKIKDASERLNVFNSYMKKIYVKVAQGETDPKLSAVISGRDTSSEPLANFLKSFGPNWKSIKEQLPPDSLENLFDALKYTRNPIKSSALKDTDVILPTEKRFSLVKTLELDDQKEYFITPEQIKEFNFSQSQIREILSSFSHDKRKLKFLEDHRNDVSLGKADIVEIVNSLNYDSNRLKFLSANKIDSYQFTNVNCTNIIKNLQSDKSKLAVLSDLNKPNIKKEYKLNLENDQIRSIICSLEDDINKLEYLNIDKLKELFQNSDQIELRKIATEIACSLKEDQNILNFLTQENIDKFRLIAGNVALIATKINEDQNKHDFIERASELHNRNNRKKTSLHNKEDNSLLESKYISRIVSSYKDDSLKLEYLNSKGPYLNTKDPSGTDKAKVLSSITNIETLQHCLDGKADEKVPFYDEIAPYKMQIILGLFNDQKSISLSNFDTVCQMADINPDELHNLSIPVLPLKMTIGVELETVGADEQGDINADTFKDFRKVLGDFQAKRDTSLLSERKKDGVEIISPILMNHNLENLNLVSTLLQKNHLTTNDTCGAHVHIGADYLDSVEAWQHLKEIWGNNEDIMYQIVNERGKPLRPGVKEYARPLSPKMALAKETTDGSVSLNNEDDLDKLLVKLKQLQYGKNREFQHILDGHDDLRDRERIAEESDYHKYYALNFKNINSVSKNTIEFRLPNGTIDPQTLMDNIRLFSSVVNISKQLGDIEIAQKNGQPLTQEQVNLALAREKLVKVGTSQESQKERLDALMNLLFSDDVQSQNVYKDRYTDFPKDSIEEITFAHFPYRICFDELALRRNKFGKSEFSNYYDTNSAGIGEFLQEVNNSQTILQSKKMDFR